MTALEKGSLVNYGSLNNEDLVPAFMEILKEIDLESYKYYCKEICEWTLENPNINMFDDEMTDMMTEVREQLLDEISDYAPKGFYFGSHPDNSSDFGIWEVEDDNY